MDNLLIYGALAVLIVVSVGIFMLQQRGQQSAGGVDVLPYRKRDYFFTKAERSFYEVLLQSLPSDMVVFAKVRLLDLVYLPKGTEKRQTYLNQVQAKHVDFVLCDREKLAPVLVIELDDSSHQRQDRQARDHFLEQALQVAGFPLLRVPVQTGYAPRELASMIQEKLSLPSTELPSPHLIPSINAGIR